MRFLYSCDIHGDKNKYEKLLVKAIEEKIEYIVIGGDILPKRGDRTVIQPEFIQNFLNDYFKRLQENNIKFIFIPGNDDLEEIDAQLKSLCNKYTNVFNIDNNLLEVEDIDFIGLSKVLDHPFANKNRILVEEESKMQPQLSQKIYINKRTEIITVEEWEKYRMTNVKKMKDELEGLPKPNKNKKAIYVLHCPPYGIGLDVCRTKEEVGSKQIRKFLESSNIYMSFHGHIHESPDVSGIWENKLNETICIQPGQTEYGDLECHCVLIDTISNQRILQKV